MTKQFIDLISKPHVVIVKMGLQTSANYLNHALHMCIMCLKVIISICLSFFNHKHPNQIYNQPQNQQYN